MHHHTKRCLDLDRKLHRTRSRSVTEWLKMKRETGHPDGVPSSFNYADDYPKLATLEKAEAAAEDALLAACPMTKGLPYYNP